MGIEPLIKVTPTSPAIALEPGNDWQQLWFAAARHQWSTLAIIPAQPGTSSLTAARLLAAAGQLYPQRPVHLVEAEGTDPTATGFVASSAANRAASGERVIIAIDSPLSHPAAIPIARAVDAALLLIPLGRTRLSAARRTIECVGRQRFIGSITVKARR